MKLKRFLLLLALFAATSVALLTHESWLPWLDGYLNERETSQRIQTMDSLVNLVLSVGSLFFGYLAWVYRPRSTEPTTPVVRQSDVTYVSDRPFKPSPPVTTSVERDQNPYLGLRAFQRTDADRFFGRAQEINEALATFGEPIRGGVGTLSERYRWLQVEGNSGAGKSSLVNAGLVPGIEAGALESVTGFEDWRVIGPILPGERPLRRLAEALQRALIADAVRRDTLACQRELEGDEQALSYQLSDFRETSTAFLLIVDQFEELFTFSEQDERRCFDAQLAYALQDRECPLFLINTVRIDFLHAFEHLPKLSELYNSHCRRYLLKTISRNGLVEVIERPAAQAEPELDVSEITAAMVRDAAEEIGALPLVENALHYLWQKRDGYRLVGRLYTEIGGIFGMLEAQADELLTTMDAVLPNGRERALELLLALTEVNDRGNHSRRRLSLEEARGVAAGRRRNPEDGQRLIDWLAGRPGPADRSVVTGPGDVRLVSITNESDTTSEEQEATAYVDLIHETLIRARYRDPSSGKRIGYWQTLYDYVEKNRDRSFRRGQLARRAQRWETSHGIRRWFALAGWRDLWRYRWFHPGKGDSEHRYKRASLRWAAAQGVVLAVLLGIPLQGYLWTLSQGLPPGYTLTLQKFRLMRLGVLPEPVPRLVRVEPPAPSGAFRVGERDEEIIDSSRRDRPELLQYLGIPWSEGQINASFAIGVHEVTYEQFDWYVWSSRREGKEIDFPGNAPNDNGRGQRAVVNVSWLDANAYLAWLSERTGKSYRLPTETEWEYAARAETNSAFWWGNEEGTANANCDGCGSDWDNRYVAPVGSFEPNAWGLHDTAGNVYEWTCSEWQASFDGSESVCMEPEETAGSRAVRGGSWFNEAVWVRSSSRSRDLADNRINNVGFRVLRAARTD